MTPISKSAWRMPIKKPSQKLVSGAIKLIEAQEIILKRASDALITLKDGNKAKSPGKVRESLRVPSSAQMRFLIGHFAS